MVMSGLAYLNNRKSPDLRASRGKFSCKAISNKELFDDSYENRDFLTQQIITYIGNKRSLLNFITRGIQIAQNRLNKKKLDIFDVFTGSGIVARHCKQFSNYVLVNDLERYAAVTSECYLSNKDELDMPSLRDIYNETFPVGG